MSSRKNQYALGDPACLWCNSLLSHTVKLFAGFLQLTLLIAFNCNIPLCWHSAFKLTFWKREAFNLFYHVRQHLPWMLRPMLVLWRLIGNSLHLLDSQTGEKEVAQNVFFLPSVFSCSFFFSK